MTTAITNSPAPRLNRVNTEPRIGTVVRPELQRTNTAPAALGTQQPAPASTTPATAQTKPTSTSLPSKIGDAFSKAGSKVSGWHGNAVSQATSDAQASGGSVLSKLKAGAGLAGGVNGIVTNTQGLVNAIKNGEGGQAIAANALGLTRGVIGTAQGALNTAAAIESTLGLGKVTKAAKDAVGTPGKLGQAITSAVADAVHNGKALRDVDVLASIAKGQGTLSNLKTTVQMAVADKLRAAHFEGAANKIEGKVADAGRKAAQGLADAKNGVGKAITEAGTKATGAAGKAAEGLADAAKGGKLVDGAIDAAKGAESVLKVGAKGAGTAARLAGRFAPGLNIAMAGVDTAIAARTWTDPKSTTADKVTSTITAAGSVVAATNIPIVSQVGAAVSAGSSIVGAALKNGDKIKEGFHKLGDKLKSFF